MGYIIAIAGKGGVGKTTVAALITRRIVDARLGSVLVVDADPNSNLAELLGGKVKETVGDIIGKIASDPSSVPQGMTKDRFIEYKVQTSLSEDDGFDILTMGLPEGPGCYCYVNNVLRGVVSKLIADYDYIIIDNEAGLEHLSRRTSRRADSFLIVSDSSAVGLKAAYRINGLIKQLKFEKQHVFLLINRAARPAQAMLKDPGVKNILAEGAEYLGGIPYDEDILTLSIKGEEIFKLKKSAASIKALDKMGDRLWQKNALKSGQAR